MDYQQHKFNTHGAGTEPFGRAWGFAETEFCHQS